MTLRKGTNVRRNVFSRSAELFYQHYCSAMHCDSRLPAKLPLSRHFEGFGIPRRAIWRYIFENRAEGGVVKGFLDILLRDIKI